jgi:hypothetical protein
LGKFAEAIAGFNLLGALAISAIGHAAESAGKLACLRVWSIGGLLDRSLGPGTRSAPSMGWVAWLPGRFAATILYLAIASLQLAVLAIHRPPNRGDDPT